MTSRGLSSRTFSHPLNSNFFEPHGQTDVSTYHSRSTELQHGKMQTFGLFAFINVSYSNAGQIWV